MRVFLTATVVVLLLNACGITGYERWAAYQLDVLVETADRQPLAGAVIKSSESQEVTTDKNGMAQLRYTTSGIKVITVTAPGWKTVQSRVPVPSDEEETLHITLTEPAAQLVPQRRFAEQ